MTKINKINQAIRLYQELLPIAKALHHQDENACNYGLTPRQEKIVENLERKADTIARNWVGLRAYHQSDPRGASLYLVERIKDANREYTNGVCISW